jgi:hypothetical protein
MAPTIPAKMLTLKWIGCPHHADNTRVISCSDVTVVNVEQTLTHETLACPLKYVHKELISSVLVS